MSNRIEKIVPIFVLLSLIAAVGCAPAASQAIPPTNTPAPTATAVPEPTSQFTNLTADDLTSTLFDALRTDDVETAQALIQAGVDLNAAEGQISLTPIMIATIRNNIEMFSLLLEAGADPTVIDNSGNNLLHHTVNKNGTEIAAILLTLDDIDIEHEREQYGFTPLLQAAFDGQLEMVDLLIEAGANIEAGDDWGDTPLNVATWNGKMVVVERLLELGAEPDVANVQGSNALDHAKSQNHEEIEALLLTILEGEG